jgi:hypothetical protein
MYILSHRAVCEFCNLGHVDTLVVEIGESQGHGSLLKKEGKVRFRLPEHKHYQCLAMSDAQDPDPEASQYWYVSSLYIIAHTIP